MLNPRDWLLEALNYAKAYRGFCAPNPAVGAIVVKDDQLLATGEHRGCGKFHAEAEALSKLGKEAEGATLYVTLEPCSHHGRTPPCTDLMIARRLAHVYYGFADPNPDVSGNGAISLEKAGIPCEHIEVPEINEFYQSYARWACEKYPWITAKIAMSLDAKIGLEGEGDPLRITGDSLMAITHQWRQQSDAILTTIATVKRDNPQLNVRSGKEIIAKPVYMIDPNLEFSSKFRLMKTARKLTIFYRKSQSSQNLKKLSDLGVICKQVDSIDFSDFLRIAVKQIAVDGCHDLWVEAGGRCFSTLVCTKLVQHAIIYVAPKLIGERGISAFSTQSDLLSEAKQFNWEIIENEAILHIRW